MAALAKERYFDRIIAMCIIATILMDLCSQLTLMLHFDVSACWHCRKKVF
jgi:hypothetical protein